jgi:hypothetical protein
MFAATAAAAHAAGNQRAAGSAELKLINMGIGEVLQAFGFLPGLAWQLGPGSDIDELIDHPELGGGGTCPSGSCHSSDAPQLNIDQGLLHMDISY